MDDIDSRSSVDPTHEDFMCLFFFFLVFSFFRNSQGVQLMLDRTPTQVEREKLVYKGVKITGMYGEGAS